MIQKVNRPEFQLIVSSPKALENDPGSSQGGGNAYDSLPDPRSETPKSEAKPENLSGSTEDSGSPFPPLKEPLGFGNVVLEFRRSEKASAPVAPGLRHHYRHEGGVSKGLLLNKKAE